MTSFVDQLRQLSARLLDTILDVFPEDMPGEVSIVISHPGRTDDAIIVGTHDIAQLLRVVADMEGDPNGREMGIATATSYTPDSPSTDTLQ